MQTIGVDLDLKWLVMIWVGDLMRVSLVMGGTMVLEHEGTFSDPCKPIGSQGSMV